jgi:uncharacterized membrane protein
MFFVQLRLAKQIMALYIMASMQRSCLELIGRSNEMARVTGIVYDDTAFENYLKTSKAEFSEFFLWMQCCHVSLPPW